MIPFLSRIRRSLALKMGISVGIILLICISSFTFFNIRELKKQLIQRLMLRADRFSETVQRATRFGMLINDREHVARIIEALAAQEGIEGIRVFSKKGVIMYSSRVLESGAFLSKKDPPCSSCHESLEPLEHLPLKQRARFEKGSGQKHVLTIIASIPNESGCFTAACHVHTPAERKLGVLEVSMSMVKIDEEIRRNVRRTLLFDLLLFLFITAIIIASLLLFVNRPIKRLVQGAKKIGEGRLKEVIAIDSRDEIGELARAFNEMSERISSYTQDLEHMVTERTEDFRKSEERYRLIFQGSQDGILLTTPEGKLLEINPTGVSLLGRDSKRSALEHFNLHALFVNFEDWHLVRKTISQGGFINDFETLLQPQPGLTIEALLSAHVIKDASAQMLGYVLLLKDVTDKKKAERHLLHEKQTIEGILEGSPIAMFVVDHSHQVIHWNKACEQLTGKSKAEMIRTQDQWKAFYSQPKPLMSDWIIEENSNGLYESYGDKKLKESPFIPGAFQAEDFFPFLGQGGRHLLFLSAPIRDQEGRILAAITTLQDVTEQRRAEAVIQRNIREIEQAYEELKSTQEQLIQSARLASLGKLAATIAHEINNPLAGVLNYIKLLIKIFKKDPLPLDRLEDIRAFLSIMEKETTRSGEIVKNLLSFSRPSVVRLEATPINDIIEQALNILTHKIEISGVQLQRDLGRDLPPVICDFKQIQQALMNIIINGVEAMPEGGTLTIASRTLTEANMVEVEIRDTGLGISKENLKNLFEPFFTTKSEGKGVGLGLSVSYGIISKHEGVILVESTPGQGTQFRVRLPRQPGEGNQSPG